MGIFGRLLQAFAIALMLTGAVVGVSGVNYYINHGRVSASGIRDAEFVRVGGIDQWVQIRGEDRANPVLLVIPGGTGTSPLPRTPEYRAWEKQFTVALWDQRGEGRTFGRAGARGTGPMTIERMAQDGVEVAEYLRKRLGKQKIIVVGQGWGSVLGVHMVKARPDLFAAYVGAGQVTRMPAMMATSYPLLLERARAWHSFGARASLRRLGPPPWKDAREAGPWFLWSQTLDPKAPPEPWTLSTPWETIQGMVSDEQDNDGEGFSRYWMGPVLMELDVTSLGPKFDVPVLMIQGSDDLITPTVLAKQYFDGITAPRKDFVLLPGAGHSAMFSDNERFLQLLVQHVRPLALAKR